MQQFNLQSAWALGVEALNAFGDPSHIQHWQQSVAKTLRRSTLVEEREIYF